MYDIIIIGGGTSGLAAAIYARRVNKKVLLIENDSIGGQILNVEVLNNYPGIINVKGEEFARNLKKQVEDMGTDIVIDEVTKLEKEHDIFFIFTKSNQTYQSKTVIYAAGVESNKLGIKGEEEFRGKGISNNAIIDGPNYKDKVIAIVGGGNTAIDSTLYLSNIAKKIYLIHRRDIFKTEPIKIESIKEKPNVVLLLNTIVTEINGKDKIESIKIEHEGKEQNLDVEGLFINIGHTPNTKLVEDLITLNPHKYIITNHDLETQLPGLFAACNVREKRVDDITSSIADGTLSSLKAIEYIDSKL